jgi:hypothetical protein
MQVILKILLGILLGVGTIAVIAGISLLTAWPVMWCWNYAVVPTFKMPVITWGMAWCLSFLASVFFKPSANVTANKKD